MVRSRHGTATRAGHGRRRRAAGTVVLALAMVFGLNGCLYKVALFGDMPYSSSQYSEYETMLGTINATKVAFSTHVGDFQDNTSNCTDSVVQQNITWFDSLVHPLIFTPGDNDWTDCNGPLTRLARLRNLIFRDTGTESRGQTPRALESQAAQGYPENARWVEGRVTYVTIHVVGSSDDKSIKAEFDARRAANIAWLHAAFDLAKTRGDLGIVVLAQSSLRFELAEGDKGAFETMFTSLRDETLAFPGQVLYVHGDGHHFKDDHPMVTVTGDPVANFHRVEVPGGSTIGWVKLTVDDKPDAELFSIALQ